MACYRSVLILFLLCCTGQSEPSRNGTIDDWIWLTNVLFANYTKEIYPVHSFASPLTIDVTMFLLTILDFDEVTGIITLNGGILLHWMDFRLIWDPSLYGGIEEILVKSSRVWTPNVFLLSTADELKPFDSEQFDVRLYYDGSSFISPGKQMRASCSVDVSRFPFDTHTCELVLILWDAYVNEVKLGHMQTEADQTYYIPNGEWDIVNTMVSMYEKFPGSISITIQIRRKSMYFALSLMIPILLLCFLNPFVFLIPASSGERISYIITMFLAMAVYVTLIGENLPKVSENMAYLSFFLLIALIYSGTLIVCTILTLRLESKVDVHKFPDVIKRLTIMCRQRRTYTANADGVHTTEDTKQTKKSIICLQKDEVISFVDVSLFASSLIVISIITIGFLSVLFS
ncbi:neuronal acetylcholine receptor subunit alpha-7-like [Argopecten irradians]|uniref:neuronal acetylcholine receptor subunit alpha-7-like n=1 Tax=Argopecten irradians TaxID=31199 RepID=UPI0037141093